MARQLYIDQSNMSHRINEIWWEGNILKGKVEAASTARGDDFHRTVLSGSRVGFSLRAVGPVTKQRNGYVEIADPLTIYSYDWILHPSHRIAYMDKIINESMEMGSALCETAGIFVPYYAGKPIDYIKDASQNFKAISEQFELDVTGGADSNRIFLSEDCSKVYIENGNDVVAVNMEKHLTNEINGYMSKFII